MAVRVRDFSRAHASSDASYASVLAEFERQVTRMSELAKQQQGGLLTGLAATKRRQGLRRRLHHELLRHLVTVAEVAADASPGPAGQYRMPGSHGPNEAFRTQARKMLEQAQADREVLTRHGLADRLLEDLAAALDQFDASVAESNLARRAHVGARAELKAASDDVMRLVDLLDGLNRYRFSGNAELRAAWESARNVVSGPTAAAPVAETPPNPAGESRPAA